MSVVGQEITSIRSPGPARFLGQPRPLATLVGVEVWERFSFYGMLGILLLYLYTVPARGGLGIGAATAASVVGAYGASVYLATVAAAWFADRVFGLERVLFGGAVLVMAGHLALSAVPGRPGVTIGLILVAVGAGGVKVTATAIVGTLYAPGDRRRDAGFSLFYLGINLGALTGVLLTGLLQQQAGFRWGFGLAAAGMAAGLFHYARGRRRLPGAARQVPHPLPPRRRALAVAGSAVTLLAVIAIGVTGVVSAGRLLAIVVTLIVLAAAGHFILILSHPGVTGPQRRRVVAFIPLFLACAVFCSLYQQQFTVVTFYSDHRLDRQVLGWEIPVSWVHLFNPVFVIVLAGLFAALWTRLGPHQPSIPGKFALGTAVMGAAFLLFLPYVGTGTHGVPLPGLAGILLVFAVAELVIQPIGLSAATQLAPDAFRTRMVALFFLAVALGTATSGALARHYSERHETAYFGILGLIALAVGAGLWAAGPLLRRLMGAGYTDRS